MLVVPPAPPFLDQATTGQQIAGGADGGPVQEMLVRDFGHVRVASGRANSAPGYLRKYIIGAFGLPTKQMKLNPYFLMIHTALRALVSLASKSNIE